MVLISLLSTRAQAWAAKSQLFHLNRETADRRAVFTSGWEVHSCVWLPTLFLHLQVGEGLIPFVVLVFLSAGGGHVLGRCRRTPGVGEDIFLNLDEQAIE